MDSSSRMALNPDDPGKYRSAPRPQTGTNNNPFIQSASGTTSTTAPELDSQREPGRDEINTNPLVQDQKSSPPLRKSKVTHSKPGGLLSRFLNFGLDTTPNRLSEDEDYGVKIDPWNRASLTAETYLNQQGPESSLLGMPFDTICNNEEVVIRRKFILKLAKALMSFGAPSHRIESQLAAASKVLDTRAEFVHLPNIIIVTIRNGNTASTRTYFVRATGRISLTSLNQVHYILRAVLHDTMSCKFGTDALRSLLRAPPIYSLWLRCCLAFICASILCVLAFGGSVLDMYVSGSCAFVLQYLGLNAANKSSMYANVYEISVTIIVAFLARGLSSIPGRYFCYGAVSSAGVVVVLPGFTILVSALELMSKNMFCGSVRIVYAIIYTLFLGFGLTIGSDLYLVIDHRAREAYYKGPPTLPMTHSHGTIQRTNSSTPVSGVLGITGATAGSAQILKGCIRDPRWGWVRQPLPWWTMFLLVPMYSICSSLSNLQNAKTWHGRKQLAIMVTFSCCSWSANKATSLVLPNRTDIISAAGAFVIGCLGNGYSRLFRGTAFTSMVTGVLFLVPSGIAQGGGLTQTYRNSADQYSNGFSLALRMISVACGVTIGLFVSQVLVYLFGSSKHVAHFAF
ncbi:hypothetical protein B0H10DRAFT_1350210 [Mycena sp. CBHHK59/15]|nr:hypothetical protein B0H10DRAFT_1350210 [Mycena sp. CBHHK59/15]